MDEALIAAFVSRCHGRWSPATVINDKVTACPVSTAVHYCPHMHTAVALKAVFASITLQLASRKQQKLTSHHPNVFNFMANRSLSTPMIAPEHF